MRMYTYMYMYMYMHMYMYVCMYTHEATHRRRGGGGGGGGEPREHGEPRDPCHARTSAGESLSELIELMGDSDHGGPD